MLDGPRKCARVVGSGASLEHSLGLVQKIKSWTKTFFDRKSTFSIEKVLDLKL